MLAMELMKLASVAVTHSTVTLDASVRVFAGWLCHGQNVLIAGAV